MTERHIPETYVGKDYVVIINNNEAYKIAKDRDEDKINLEIENMNKARESGIPVPKVIEVIDRGMIMEMAKGNLALDIWDKFDIDKKKTFILSLTSFIKKLPKKEIDIISFTDLSREDTDKGILYLAHMGLNLQNIFVNDDGKITDIIGWRDCEYLPEIYIRRLPSFLREDNPTSDTKILSDIFYKEMGKLSEVEQLVTELRGVDNREDAKTISERFDAEMEKVTIL